MPYKLGKLPPKVNPKTLLFKDYLLAQGPPPPPQKLWREYKVPAGAWGMDGNDQVGDCTCAAVAHMLTLVTAETGKMLIPATADALGMYSAVTGYVPGDPSTDNGAAITDVLDYWRTTGLCGHKILAWAQIDHTNIDQVKQAIYLFGSVDIGVQLPNSAVEQNQAGEPWKIIPDDGGIAGGHSIPLFGYGAVGTNCITWGARQELAWDWFRKYCDECYAPLTQDWINAPTGLAPNMLNLEALKARLAELQV